MEKYIDSEMCKKCGGVCCKQCGCIYLPSDFESMEFDYLKQEIDKGNISIAGAPYTGFYGSAWSFILYLRARNLDAEIVDFFPTGSPCKLLTETGCKLSEDARPSLGLLVKPTVIGGPCEKKYSTEDVMEEWLKYSLLMEKLLEYYTDKSAIEVIVAQIQEVIEPIKEKFKYDPKKLTELERVIFSWYYKIMVEKPYYTPEEAKVFQLCISI